jgi:hypothetical protein
MKLILRHIISNWLKLAQGASKKMSGNMNESTSAAPRCRRRMGIPSLTLLKNHAKN